MTAQTRKTATKKVAAPKKSLTPLIDAAKLTNPHKGPNGWDKDAANALRVELQTILDNYADDPASALRLIADYGPLAGWKEVAKMVVKAAGL